MPPPDHRIWRQVPRVRVSLSHAQKEQAGNPGAEGGKHLRDVGRRAKHLGPQRVPRPAHHSRPKYRDLSGVRGAAWL